MRFVNSFFLVLVFLFFSQSALSEGTWGFLGCADPSKSFSELGYPYYNCGTSYSCKFSSGQGVCQQGEDIVYASSFGNECDGSNTWNQQTFQCSPPPPTCSQDSSSCPNETPQTTVSGSTENGVTTTNKQECYSDGTCSNETVTTQTNPDGSEVTNTTKTAQDSEGNEVIAVDQTVEQKVENTDDGSSVTTTTTDNISGETNYDKTSANRNSDGTYTWTREQYSSTTGETTNETWKEDDNGQVTDSVDCSDLAYINNPICRWDSPTTDTASCGDYSYSLVGENSCVSQCPSGYAQLGRDCIKRENQPETPSDNPQDDFLSEIASNTSQSLGLERKIDENTKKTYQEIQNQTQVLGKKLDTLIDKPVGSGGGGDTGEGDEPSSTTWSQSGEQQLFDVAGIDADIESAKQELKNLLSSIRAEASSIFSPVTVSNSVCNTTFNNPISGSSIRFCPSDYLPQLSALANAMLAIAYLLAAVIIVRR